VYFGFIRKYEGRGRTMHDAMKRQILDIAKLIWDRRLSDTAGGNISVQENDIICITPKLMGYRLRWQITEDDLSILRLDGEVIEGPREITREGRIHLGLYNEFDDAHAIIHAHPYWTSIFVARAQRIFPVLQMTEKFGTIECIDETPGRSEELAERVKQHFVSKREQWKKTALEVILPRHGIVAMGKDMNACFDIVDRVESDCRCQILGKLLDL